MTSTAQKILEAALELSDDERLRVGEVLIDSVPGEIAAEIERAWAAEAVRRAGAFERGETEALDGEQVLRDLEGELRSSHG